MFRRKGISGLLFAAFLLCLIAFAIYAGAGAASIPDEIYLIGDSERTIDISFPFTLEAAKSEEAAVSALKLNGESLTDHEAGGYTETVTISSDGECTNDFKVKLFGFITVKTVKVTAMEDVMLVPGGQNIGVVLHTEGALVVGCMKFTAENGASCNPAEDAGLQPGDVIEKYNGTVVENASHLSELVNEFGGMAGIVTIIRDEEKLSLEVTPMRDISDGMLKLGVWVRDSTLGVGTLTFFEPISEKFAGLGHAITDIDTGELLTVKSGTIVEAKVIEVVKGQAGAPGEIRGYFDSGYNVVGDIYSNTEYGIYGKTETLLQNKVYKLLEAADRSQVEVGPATILCTLDKEGIKEYSCRIVKLNKQNSPGEKSFVIEIDDPALIEKTGGIIQGMSGSPIIQNGKLIGAVTHVFVDNPQKGYGIYIDWMLAEMYHTK